MALPPEFSDWEHFQSTLIAVQNRRIREEFNDADDDDISTPRSSLKQACLLKDGDSALQTLSRLWLYYVVLGGATALHPPLYSIPSDRYQQLVRFAPQITLYFKEDISDVEDGFAPLDAEISFRLMHESSTTVTKEDLRQLATKIRSEFAAAGGYRWKKGRVKLNYRDQERGYLLSINAFSESEGKEIINKVLDLQSHTLDNERLTINQLGEAPPIMPPTQQILGKTRRQPRRRPVGYVRFVWAEAHLWGIPEGITLLDRSGRRRNPIITV